MAGVGGTILEGADELNVASFISDFAAAFISTKLIGKIPMRSPSFPSAQFSSTRRITEIRSALLNDRQSFSSTSDTRKSYSALHWGGTAVGSGTITWT